MLAAVSSKKMKRVVSMNVWTMRRKNPRLTATSVRVCSSAIRLFFDSNSRRRPPRHPTKPRNDGMRGTARATHSWRTGAAASADQPFHRFYAELFRAGISCHLSAGFAS